MRNNGSHGEYVDEPRPDRAVIGFLVFMWLAFEAVGTAFAIGFAKDGGNAVAATAAAVGFTIAGSLLVGVFAYAAFRTRYVLSDTHLEIRMGIVASHRISLRQIRTIERRRVPLSSLSRLLVNNLRGVLYVDDGRWFVSYISPRDPDLFLAEIEARIAKLD